MLPKGTGTCQAPHAEFGTHNPILKYRRLESFHRYLDWVKDRLGLKYSHLPLKILNQLSPHHWARPKAPIKSGPGR